MNIREIQDRLIGAETVMRELSEGRVGPAPLRAQQLPYVHTDADMRNWGHRRGDKRSIDPKANACRLRKEDDEAYSILRQEFWEQFDPGPTPEDVSIANQIKAWVMLVDDDGERRALQAWVRAMAGGRSFARWCKNVEHIAVMTGRRRKNRAVEKILAQLSGKADLHCENGPEGVLPVTTEISDVSPTLASNASGEETGLTSWWADDAFQPFIKVREVINEHIAIQTVDAPQSEFNWAKRRNEIRRQREAKRRKKQAA